MSDDFFVGWGAAVPRNDRRFLRGVVPLLLLLALAVAGTIASASRDPGSGSWAWDTEEGWEGVLRVDPYARLVLDDGRSALVVSVGKFDAVERLRDHADGRVRLSGTRLERDGHLMIELGDAETAVATLDGAAPPAAPGVDGGRVTLRGEILDSKCHLGAMKPGDGATHKACATLCIQGGIPPVLGTWDSTGTASHWLLTDTDGGPAGTLVEGRIGEPVSVEGRVTWRDGVAWLAVEAVRKSVDQR